MHRHAMLFCWLAALCIPLISSTAIQDPDFEEFEDNWLLAKQSLVMMKNLPEGANFTMEEYYGSYNLDYVKEEAKKDISGASVEYINREIELLAEFSLNFTVKLRIQIANCKSVSKMMINAKREDYSKNITKIDWSVEYCATEKVKIWCSTGSRLEVKVEANGTVKVSDFKNASVQAALVATCPDSAWDTFVRLFHTTDGATWHFTRFFYASVFSISVLILFAVLIVALHWKKFL